MVLRMTLQYLSTVSEITGHSLVAATSKSSSGTSTFILLIVVFAAMYFLWLRPQRKKLQQRQMSQVRSIEVGDEVVTQSGIIGTVVELDDDRAEIQVASGVTVTVVRAAIGRRIEPVVPPTDENDAQNDYYSPQSTDNEPEPPEKKSFWPRRGRGEDS